MSEEISQESAVADRLRLWLEGGRPQAGIRDSLVAGTVDEGRIKLLPSSGESLIFVEESQAQAAQALTGSTVVGYNGEFSTNGGEIGIGDGFVVQLEGYATAPYVAISCPTVFAIEEDSDRDAVAADADVAFESGVFPRFLLTPLVTVLDQHYWQNNGRLSSDPARLFVPAGGAEILSGPAGGAVKVSASQYSSEAPVAGEANAEFLVQNPGVGRFLGAAKVLRAAQSRLEPGARIAGFGQQLVSGDADGKLSRHREDSVFVILADEQHFITDLRTGKLSKVPRDVAEAVETVLSGAGLPAALQDRLGLKLSGKDLAPAAQVKRSKDLQKLFASLSIETGPATAMGPVPAVAVPVNPALIIVPVIVT